MHGPSLAKSMRSLAVMHYGRSADMKNTKEALYATSKHKARPGKATETAHSQLRKEQQKDPEETDSYIDNSYSTSAEDIKNDMKEASYRSAEHGPKRKLEEPAAMAIESMSNQKRRQSPQITLLSLIHI